jgi:hypothetical protein
LPFLLAAALIPVVLLKPDRVRVLRLRSRAIRSHRHIVLGDPPTPPPTATGATADSILQAPPPTTEAADGDRVEVAPVASAGASPAVGVPTPTGRRSWLSPFVLGIYSRPWLNTRYSVGWGLPLAAIPLAVTLALSLPATVEQAGPLLLLQVSLNVAEALVYWVGVAFLFGLGFEIIRGRTGIRKGLWMGGLAALATVPFSAIDLVTGREDALHAITSPVLLISYFALLGLAFDVKLTRRYSPSVHGLRARVERVAETSGLREVSAVAIAVILAISLQLQNALAGQVTTFVQSGLAAVIPTK